MTSIKDKDDKIQSKDEGIKNRWKGYFGTLEVIQPTQGPIENITEAEVKTQLDKMVANQSRGPGDLPVKVFKLQKDAMLQ